MQHRICREMAPRLGKPMPGVTQGSPVTAQHLLEDFFLILKYFFYIFDAHIVQYHTEIHIKYVKKNIYWSCCSTFISL